MISKRINRFIIIKEQRPTLKLRFGGSCLYNPYMGDY
nr:MAG TPA: hypothetical protein [Caudoviricetes sp.]